MWHDNMPFQVDYHIAVYTHGILPLDASVSTDFALNRSYFVSRASWMDKRREPSTPYRPRRLSGFVRVHILHDAALSACLS